MGSLTKLVSTQLHAYFIDMVSQLNSFQAYLSSSKFSSSTKYPKTPLCLHLKIPQNTVSLLTEPNMRCNPMLLMKKLIFSNIALCWLLIDQGAKIASSVSMTSEYLFFDYYNMITMFLLCMLHIKTSVSIILYYYISTLLFFLCIYCPEIYSFMPFRRNKKKLYTWVEMLTLLFNISSILSLSPSA